MFSELRHDEASYSLLSEDKGANAFVSPLRKQFGRTGILVGTISQEFGGDDRYMMGRPPHGDGPTPTGDAGGHQTLPGTALAPTGGRHTAAVALSHNRPLEEYQVSAFELVRNPGTEEELDIALEILHDQSDIIDKERYADIKFRAGRESDHSSRPDDIPAVTDLVRWTRRE